jgi:hypothetical protein
MKKLLIMLLMLSSSVLMADANSRAQAKKAFLEIEKECFDMAIGLSAHSTKAILIAYEKCLGTLLKNEFEGNNKLPDKK